MPASSDGAFAERPTVLVVGGIGLFGSRLSLQLIEDGWDCVVAGRREAPLADWCVANGGRFAILDTNDATSIERALETVQPFAVVDCAGPFQLYAEPYALHRAALRHRAHSLDIADAAEFVAGIDALDEEAREAGRTVLSGVSSTPALAAAVVRKMAGDMDIEIIESAILPGNRAPRGLSVMRSILHQVGRRVPFYRGGRWEQRAVWSATRRHDLSAEPLYAHGRLGSLVDTPDRLLFPGAFGARSVSFRAGLELPLFHRALQIARHLGPGRLEPLARPMLWVADLFKRFGSDRGGMAVEMTGRTANGWERRSWHLLVGGGAGPRIPTVPVLVALQRLRDGAMDAGARPCLHELALKDLEEAMRRFGVRTAVHVERIVPPFRAVLDDLFEQLPPTVATFHDTIGVRRYAGRCDVEPPDGWLAKVMALVAGFPLRPSRDVEAHVTVEADGDGETWTRHLGAKRFRSRLRAIGGRMVERFGPLDFDLNFAVEGGTMRYEVTGGRFGPISLPSALLPRSEAFETEAEGRFRFDVGVRTRSGRRVVRYVGWLEPVPDEPPKPPC